MRSSERARGVLFTWQFQLETFDGLFCHFRKCVAEMLDNHVLNKLNKLVCWILRKRDLCIILTGTIQRLVRHSGGRYWTWARSAWNVRPNWGSVGRQQISMRNLQQTRRCQKGVCYELLLSLRSTQFFPMWTRFLCRVDDKLSTCREPGYDTCLQYWPFHCWGSVLTLSN